MVLANFTYTRNNPIKATFESGIGIKDHDKLYNRDLSDQHPISAITGLQEALDTIPDDYVSEAELEAALLEKQDVISDLSEIRQGATLGATSVQPSDLDDYATQNWVENKGYITGINSSDVTTALGYTPYNSSNPNGYQTENQVANSIATETTNRENADISLQNQIDAIVASSDVFDIVGTYAELQAYDISTVPVNDIIKVLVDSTHSNAATYYRCVETGGVKSWSYIGSEGAYYTKGEADSTFVPQTRKVNNKALSSDITLTASDVGADLAGSATTAETNAKNYADSLASNYATSSQGALADTALQPNDNISELQNDVGYITGITSTDVTTALGYTPYDASNPSGYQENVIETVKVNGTALTPTNKAVDIVVPTVNNPTITITQGGVTKGSFTLNQASSDTIALDAGGGGGGGSYTAGDGIIIDNNEISVDAETTSEVDVEEITEVTIQDLLATITGYDANATQTLKNINGSIQWVTD